MNSQQDNQPSATNEPTGGAMIRWVDAAEPGAIASGRAVVVLYGIDPDSRQGQSLLGLLQVMDIPVRLVAPDQLGQTVAYCAAVSGAQPSAQPNTQTAPDVQMMLMRDLKDEQINDLLKQIRESEAGPIRLKAVVTEHNRAWTLLDLIRELEEEHAMMAVYTRLRQSMQLAGSWLGTEDLDAQTAADLRGLLSQATDLISGSEPPPIEAMEAMDREIRNRL